MSPEEKAQELAKAVMEQITLQREALAAKMIEAGMVPEEYVIQDNLLEVIKNPAVAYQCWPELKVIGLNS